ncbi:MAG: hypothetical protein IBX55_00405 [Methyloprofundus sp.]|nr:hypothetical protein [Methyloprofundus sp.]
MIYQSTPKLAGQVAHWMQECDTGRSSMFMACIALGYEMSSSKKHHSHPRDASDFGRCIGLVERVPDVKSAFSIICEASKEWRGIIDHWTELVELHRVRKDGQSDEVFGSQFNRRFKEVIDPEGHNQIIERHEQSKKALLQKLKAEESRPTHSKLGVPYAPSPKHDKVIHEAALRYACPDLQARLEAYIGSDEAESVRGEIFDTCMQQQADTNMPGSYWFKELGFDISDHSAPEILEAFNGFADTYSCQVDRLIFDWVNENNIKPSLSIGQAVNFKHGFDSLSGVIHEIQNKKYSPMSYLIKVEGKKGMPIIRWDDDSIEVIENEKQ